MIDAMRTRNKKTRMGKGMFPALAFSLGILFGGLPAFAEEDQGIKQYGVVFDIAQDRKVENAGGIYQPEGLDKYMKRLIDDLAARITALEETHKRTEQKMDQALALLKEQKVKEAAAPDNPPAAKARNVFR